ncbi:MAG: type VI secretion system baseplate subunit TssG [Candidatus Zixiibacteriota bacterium]
MSQTTQALMPEFCDRHRPFHFTTALSTLAGLGIDLARVDLMAVGRYANYRGEVHEQTPQAGTELRDDVRIALKIGCSSAVDFMPYQFFQGGEHWEERARALQSPFDGSVIRHAAIAQNLAMKFNLGMPDRRHLERLLGLFQCHLEGSGGDTAESLAWVRILPTFHFWSGNAALVERILHYFFPWRFRLIENVERGFPIPLHLTERLGSSGARLGRSAVIGRSFRECDSGYELVIENVRPGQVPHLFPGAPVRKKLEWLLSVCMPGNLVGTIRVKVADRGVKLGAEHRLGYVGYATRL